MCGKQFPPGTCFFNGKKVLKMDKMFIISIPMNVDFFLVIVLTVLFYIKFCIPIKTYIYIYCIIC